MMLIQYLHLELHFVLTGIFGRYQYMVSRCTQAGFYYGYNCYNAL